MYAREGPELWACRCGKVGHSDSIAARTASRSTWYEMRAWVVAAALALPSACSLAAAPAGRARAATLLRAETVLEVAPASPPAALEEEEEAPAALDAIGRAKRYLALGNNVPQQLGPTRAADLERELHDDFEFVAPLVGPLDKKALIAATTGLDLGEGLPDFDARYHDFRLDADDPSRVWCMMRVVGTHTGPLRFGSLDAAPKDPPRRAESPPEAVSLRFADDGRLIELTTGYVVDRRVGTTGGLGGLFGVLEGIGYPLPAPLTRTTGELLAPALRALGAIPREDPSALRVATNLPRLPDARCLELTRALHAADFGVADASLLAENFTFTGPVVGPLAKREFLDAFGGFGLAAAMPDLEYRYRDLRVCPFDANRVWYTSSPSGTHTAPLALGGDEFAPTGRRWMSPPECGSAQFDGDGRCVALTGGYVMDRRMGNTDGFGGIFGLCAALGLPTPLPAWLLRTPTQNFARLTGGST